MLSIVQRHTIPHWKALSVGEYEQREKLGLVADSVIEANASLEFEDGLRTGVLHGVCWCP